MKSITQNEINFVLQILKNPKQDYNANSISKEIEISSMGALKIAKKLEKENVLVSRKLGKAVFYSINYKNSYSMQYLLFILKKQAEHSPPYIKRWISEIKKIKRADLGILFGSVILKYDKANDVDVLFVASQKNFRELKKEIEEINKLNDKKIHPIYQSKQDLIENINKGDKIILNAIKGIVVFGEGLFLDLLKK